MLSGCFFFLAIAFSFFGQQEQTEQQPRLTEDQVSNDVFHLLYTSDRLSVAEEGFQSEASKAVEGLLKDSKCLKELTSIQRVVFQRAAWKAFDFLSAQRNFTEPTNRKLRILLAKLISKTSLSPKEISELPTNYNTLVLDDEAKRSPENDLELPEDLFDPKGEWLQLTHKHINRIALTHEMSRSGRSEFLLFVKFPNGRQNAEKYVVKHNEFASIEAEKRSELLHNTVPRHRKLPKRPTLPTGTKAILLERMIVVSSDGKPVATPIVESLAFIETTPTLNRATRQMHRIKSAAFELSLQKLVDGEKKTLRRIGPGDPFEGEVLFPNGLQACANCHTEHNLISLAGGTGIRPNDFSVTIQKNCTASKTPEWKLRQANYGLLLGILESIKALDQ